MEEFKNVTFRTVDAGFGISAYERAAAIAAALQADQLVILSNVPGLLREFPEEGHRTLLAAAELIKKGKSIAIFPEGTRTPDGSLGKFKRGGFALAFQTGVPVVPVAISGSYKIMKRNNPLLWPNAVRVTIGKPIHLTKIDAPSRELYEKTVNFVRDQIEKMMAEK